MKTWLFKFISAMGMTGAVLLILLAIDGLIDHWFDCPRDKAEFAVILGLTAIYIYFKDFVDRNWK